MRPAVYASIARNRKQGARRIPLRVPAFSARKLIVMLFLGGLIFVPGITFTVLGLEEVHGSQSFSPAERVLYKVIGPAAVAIGVIVLLSSIIYYFCYGVASHTPSTRHTSSSSSHHPPSAYSSVRSAHGHDGHQAKNGDTKSSHKKRHSSSSSTASYHHHHHGHQQHHHRRNTSQSHEVNEPRKAEPESVVLKLHNEPDEVDEARRTENTKEIV